MTVGATVLKKVARWGLERAGYSLQRLEPRGSASGATSSPRAAGGGPSETFSLYGKSIPLDRPSFDPVRVLAFDGNRQGEVRDAFLLVNDAYQRLAHSPFVFARDHHVREESAYHAVHRELLEADVVVRDFSCDVPAFQDYLERASAVYSRAGYDAAYGGRSGYFPQKAFEHWVSGAYLEWTTDAVVLDLACDLSPATEALATIRPAQFYRHDIQLTTDFAMRTISGFSNAIECPDEFCDAIVAHCAIDNFEGRADTEVFIEASRILKPGGRILITPLHMATAFENVVSLGSPGVQVDDDAGICLGPPGGLRFGRHYSVAALKRRIVDAVPSLDFHVVRVVGLPIGSYPATATNRFMLIGTRRL